MTGIRKNERPWRPGDGLTCSFVGNSSTSVPCGPPTHVVESTQDRGPGTATMDVRRVVCRLHRVDATAPAKLLLRARKAATERLIVEHWDSYQEYLAEAISQVVDEDQARLMQTPIADEP